MQAHLTLMTEGSCLLGALKHSIFCLVFSEFMVLYSALFYFVVNQPFQWRCGPEAELSNTKSKTFSCSIAIILTGFCKERKLSLFCKLSERIVLIFLSSYLMNLLQKSEMGSLLFYCISFQGSSSINSNGHTHFCHNFLRSICLYVCFLMSALLPCALLIFHNWKCQILCT